MPKGFNEQEKASIREALVAGCREQWAKFGYRRTSIDDLCASAGISKGAFYKFYDSKEQLFYATILRVQAHLYASVEKIIAGEPSKYGVASALKAVYAEYDQSPFLYDVTSVDFTSFIHKLSDEQRENIYSGSLAGAKDMLNKPFLTLGVDEDLAISVLSALLNMRAAKDKMASDHTAVFAFMLDHLIDKLFV